MSLMDRVSYSSELSGVAVWVVLPCESGSIFLFISGACVRVRAFIICSKERSTSAFPEV